MTSDPENSNAKQGGRFKPGQSGNPAGKPKGCRHKATRAAEALLDGDADKLTRKAIEMALEGDGAALRLCLERVLPARRDRPVEFKLPALASVADASAAMGSILAAVADGDLTPSEGATIAGLVETHVKTIEATEFEQRLKALEAKNG